MMNSRSAHNEDLRQLEHLAPVAFALLLPYLTWAQALTCATCAIVYALLISPRVFKLTQRPEERARGFSPGKLSYATCIFFLILIFPNQLFIVVTVWANLAVGDAASNVFGRKFGRSNLPWNRGKSWAGLSAAFMCSSMAGLVLLLWTGLPGQQSELFQSALVYSVTTSIVCSLLETAPLPIDDNITICIGGSAFLVWISEASLTSKINARRFLVGLIITILVGLVAYFLKTVSRGGLISGILIGMVVFGALGLPAFLLLGTFFVLGSAFSRVGFRQKEGEGIAQENRGRRTALHVWGKGFAAFVTALSSLFLLDKLPAELSYAAAVAASLADTTATELGKVFGKKARLISSLKEVPRGTPGGVSPAGSFVGLLACGVIAVEAFFLGMISEWGILWVVLSSTIAIHLESYLLARRSGGLTPSSALMNGFHTTVAALIAVLLGRLIRK